METLDFYYDFGSPNAYFALKALEDMAKRVDFDLILKPALIGGIFKLTNNQPPWMAHQNVANKMKYMQLEIQRFIQDHNLTKFKFNSHFPVNTLLAMRGAIAAQKTGVHGEYVDVVFQAIWEDDKDISDPAVLTDTLNKAGLDGKALVAATQDPATQTIVDRGAFGLPTFFLGDEIYFGKDRVWQIEKALA